MILQVTIDGCNPSNWDAPDVVDSVLRGQVAAVNATIAIWEGFEETVDETAKWHRRFREENGRLHHVRTAQDILEARETGRLGVALGWQNISPIENKIDRLEAFRVLGVRIVQLAYNVRNLVATGCYEPNDDGLSLFGTNAVRKLNELGILIDLSHVGDKSSLQTIDASTQPVAFTHTNLREFFDHPRNKPADLIKALVANGGVVGANAYPAFLPSRFASTMSEYLDGLERLVEVAGIDHVGIATDQCEARDWEFFEYLGRLHGTTELFALAPHDPEPAIEGLAKNSDVQNISIGLRERGYGTEDVDKIMGGNWLRLYEEVWGA